MKNKNIYWMMITILLLSIIHCSAGTPAYRDLIWKKRGVSSLETINLGGHPHSVLIRGTNTANPLLVTLHGYAIPMMPFAHLDYATRKPKDDITGIMEQNFILVNYDQRGTGKTARHEAPKSSMNINQFVLDAEELIVKMLRRYQKKKVILLGISWGSLIGAKLVQKRPNLFYAFISEGQAVNLSESLKDSFDFSIKNAKKDQNKEAINELSNALIPKPEMSAETIKKNQELILKWTEYYAQKKYNLMELSSFFLKSIWDSPEYSFLDMMSTLQAIDTFTLATNKELMQKDLRIEVPELKVPVYFLMGEYDIMRFAAKDYFIKLKSPKKEWIEIPKAGHSVSADQPKKVLHFYLRKIRPLIK